MEVDEESDKNLDLKLRCIRKHGRLLEAFAHVLAHLSVPLNLSYPNDKNMNKHISVCQ